MADNLKSVIQHIDSISILYLGPVSTTFEPCKECASGYWDIHRFSMRQAIKDYLCEECKIRLTYLVLSYKRPALTGVGMDYSMANGYQRSYYSEEDTKILIEQLNVMIYERQLEEVEDVH